MIIKGITGGDIARKAGVDRSAISKVLIGKSKSRRLRAAIANALDIPYTKLWGKI